MEKTYLTPIIKTVSSYDSIQSEKVIPLVISNIVTDTLYVSARPVDKEALAMNHEFRESIKLSCEWFRFMVGLYQNTDKEIDALVYQIDCEIENRNN